jgi:hypothetical protein
MSSLEPVAQAGFFRRPNRELGRLSQSADLALARTNAAVELELARLDGLQQVAGRAMQGVAMVSQLEQQLAQLVPIAASRLQAIGDMHALASAEVVAQATRRLS